MATPTDQQLKEIVQLVVEQVGSLGRGEQEDERWRKETELEERRKREDMEHEMRMFQKMAQALQGGFRLSLNSSCPMAAYSITPFVVGLYLPEALTLLPLIRVFFLSRTYT